MPFTDRESLRAGRNRASVLALACILLSTMSLVGVASAQEADPPASDEALIRAAVLDYVQGFYEADAERLQRALHPRLVKRRVERIGDVDVLDENAPARLLAYIAQPGAEDRFPPDATAEVIILDIDGSIASAKLIADWGVDYVHLAEVNGRWVIVNVLWRAGQPSAPDAAAAGDVTPLPAGEIPPAMEIIQRHVEALGGRAAWEQAHNRVIHGTVQLGDDLTAQFTRYEAPRRKHYQLIEIEGIGRIERGTIGDVAWQIHPMAGASISEGEERALMLRLAQFNPAVRLTEIYTDIDCAGRFAVNGRPCYKLRLVPAEGEPTAWYIDEETHLLRREAFALNAGAERIEVVYDVDDYRAVDGMLFPHRIISVGGSSGEIVTITGIEHNVELPADRFQPPPAIEALRNDSP